MQRAGAIILENRPTMTASGLLQLVASVVLLSSAWPLTRLALSLGATRLWFAERRAVLSCPTGAPLVAARHRIRIPARADLSTLAAVGALQVAAYFAFAHEAVAGIPAGHTAILANTITMWVVPLSLLNLKKHIPRRRSLAAGMGLAGVAALMNPWAVDWRSAQVLIGNAFLLLAGLSWSVAIIVTRASHPSMSLFELMPWCFALASVLLLALIWWHAPDGALCNGAGCWLSLASIGFVAGPIGTRCVVEATATLPAMVSSIGFLSTPAVSLILANLFLGEPIAADLIAGSAVIMAGVGAAAWPAKRQ